MKKILLSETNPDAYMEVYAEPSEKAKPAVLIYPGGGYYVLSDTERLPIVEFYRENGAVCATPFIVDVCSIFQPKNKHTASRPQKNLLRRILRSSY